MAALIHILSTIIHLLKTNPFILVYTLDFSKAFDIVWHGALLDKMALLDMPDSIYNWIFNFFQGHSHCTRLADVVSSKATINSSVVQGSAIGPAAYIVMASDLQPLDPSNTTDTFADDSCLIIPADRASSNVQELDHIEQWAAVNNLTLNRGKSSEIVFRYFG